VGFELTADNATDNGFKFGPATLQRGGEAIFTRASHAGNYIPNDIFEDETFMLDRATTAAHNTVSG
jgi:hypothetical protein